ncbi:uncharacterized protein BDV17DRAFT_165019 [Aspergillus undulatus]|uniref:uncharacterized protein n=1 Tax=Aspergillus undulatus TaxID=1810928 RepID=UPI003CCD2C30
MFLQASQMVRLVCRHNEIINGAVRDSISWPAKYGRPAGCAAVGLPVSSLYWILVCMLQLYVSPEILIVTCHRRTLPPYCFKQGIPEWR